MCSSSIVFLHREQSMPGAPGWTWAGFKKLLWGGWQTSPLPCHSGTLSSCSGTERDEKNTFLWFGVLFIFTSGSDCAESMEKVKKQRVKQWDFQKGVKLNDGLHVSLGTVGGIETSSDLGLSTRFLCLGRA